MATAGHVTCSASSSVGMSFSYTVVKVNPAWCSGAHVPEAVFALMQYGWTRLLKLKLPC